MPWARDISHGSTQKPVSGRLTNCQSRKLTSTPSTSRWGQSPPQWGMETSPPWIYMSAHSAWSASCLPLWFLPWTSIASKEWWKSIIKTIWQFSDRRSASTSSWSWSKFPKNFEKGLGSTWTSTGTLSCKETKIPSRKYSRFWLPNCDKTFYTIRMASSSSRLSLVSISQNHFWRNSRWESSKWTTLRMSTSSMQRALHKQMILGSTSSSRERCSWLLGIRRNFAKHSHKINILGNGRSSLGSRGLQAHKPKFTPNSTRSLGKISWSASRSSLTITSDIAS